MYRKEQKNIFSQIFLIKNSGAIAAQLIRIFHLSHFAVDFFVLIYIYIIRILYYIFNRVYKFR